MHLQQYIDLTNLKPNATYQDIKALCESAMSYYFYSVCVAPCRVKDACELLGKSNVKVSTVIGFPLGSNSAVSKVAEARKAKADGADELDIVINIGKFLEGDYDYVLEEINAVAKLGLLTKVIIETCYLSKADIVDVCNLLAKSKAQFIITSTGFGAGASVGDIALMRCHLGDKVGIKAVGSIQDLQTAIEMFEAGADRVGSSIVYEELVQWEENAQERLVKACKNVAKHTKKIKSCRKIYDLPLRLA